MTTELAQEVGNVSTANDWLQTSSGKAYHPAAPDPLLVDVDDVAQALSRQCRFGGHLHPSVEFYSVAEHSVLVSKVLAHWGASPLVQLVGLLHDAAEAYVPDMVRPIKYMPQLAGYRALDAANEVAVATRFKLPAPPWPTEVSRADNAVLAMECERVMGGQRGGDWRLREPPPSDFDVAAMGLPPSRARLLFLASYERLNRLCVDRWG